MNWIDHARVCERCARTGPPGAGITYRPPGNTEPCLWCGGELVAIDPRDCPTTRAGKFCAVCAAIAGGVLGSGVNPESSPGPEHAAGPTCELSPGRMSSQAEWQAWAEEKNRTHPLRGPSDLEATP